jgi:hypothetical protein
LVEQEISEFAAHGILRRGDKLNIVEWWWNDKVWVVYLWVIDKL